MIANPDLPKLSTERLNSLDALRGFDMFWIIGGEYIFHSLAKATNWPVFNWMSHQLHHVEWNGFVFYDLIFPLFLFIAGVAMPYSIGRRLEKGDSKSAIARRIVQRGLTLVVFGIIYNGFLEFDWANTRYPSVLGRIGLAYMFGGLIFLYCDLKRQIIWFAGILLGYWAAMSWIPVPGFGAGNLTIEGSLAGYIDRLLVPGKLYLDVHDPEGLFSTIPAIGTALLGAFTGRFLCTDLDFSKEKKALYLLGAGVLALITGYLWGMIFPVNKNLWTSSFVFVTAGWSLILLSIFYTIIDIKGWTKWAFFFVVIGLNSITIYLGLAIFDLSHTVDFLFKGYIQLFSESFQPVFWWIFYTGLAWLFLYFLYRQRIFLKV